jgi:hypothetical protein
MEWFPECVSTMYLDIGKEKNMLQCILHHNHLMIKIVFFDADQKNKRLGVNAKFQSRLDTIGRRGGNEG